MQTPKLVALFGFLLLSSFPTGAWGSSNLHGFRPTKLFVFGDSYADTGNTRNTLSNSWKEPYGMTFPRKPTGRFSDGRVLTDYLARYMGLKSPVPYRFRRVVTPKQLENGMNFAVGGTGVFQTLTPGPNMSAQIDLFRRLIKGSFFTQLDLQSSVALVTLAGNDYSAYVAQNGTSQGWPSFIRRVVNQFCLNLKQIRGMGIRKVAVTALQPLGCLPDNTITSSFQSCNVTQNTLVSYHNFLLQQAVAKLNNETRDSSFIILDLFSSFMSVLNNKGPHTGSSTFQSLLKPCCIGISSQYSCGSVDKGGRKMYMVCQKPESSFFWDGVHPTQEGWRAVYMALRATLQELS